MEHYKSTFATIGAAVTGLVLAAQIMQTGAFAPDAGRPERGHVEAPAETAAWADPPARAPVAAVARAEPAGLPARVAAEAPFLEAPLPLVPASTTAPVPAAQAPAPRKAASAHKRKVVQRGARTRQAGLAVQAPAPQVAAPAPAQENRVDPIGDLIRGLGFGGDRQG